MMAGKNGYRDILNFSDDSVMLTDYYGIIARGKRYFLSCYHNVNEGRQHLVELTEEEAEKVQREYKEKGMSLPFIEKWIAGKI